MDTKKSNLQFNLLILFLSMLLSGLLCAYFGKELHFDLAGYHFYNPYAFLHDRFNVDYWPASEIQVFLSPTLDFFTYYLINNVSPMATEFILGAIHGINFALIFYINRLFVSLFINEARYQVYVAGSLVILAVFSPMVFPYLGSFTNDLFVSIFVLIFVFWSLVLLKKFSETGTLSITQFIFANVILGIAVGCKLTVGTYVIGSYAALFFLPIPLKIKSKLIILSIIANSVGMVLSSGYWMWLLWQHFRNPFFPFLNGIFHSPYFPALNWLEPRYMPTNIQEWIFFPFYFSTSIKATAEFYFLDFRLLIIYLLFVLLGIVLVFKKSPPVFKTCFVQWFYLFFIFSYVTWEICFSIMRYLGTSEMLSPILIFLLVLQMSKDFIHRIEVLTTIFLFMSVTMTYTNTERVPYGNDFFNVKLPSYVQKDTQATVLMAYSWFVKNSKPRPNHYLIPFFPKSWRFTGIPFCGVQYQIPTEVSNFVKRGPKQIYLLASSDYMPYMYKAAHELHLEASGECEVITSDRQKLMIETILLCPVQEKYNVNS